MQHSLGGLSVLLAKAQNPQYGHAPHYQPPRETETPSAHPESTLCRYVHLVKKSRLLS